MMTVRENVMKRVSVFVLAALLGFAQVGRAGDNHDTTSGDVTVTATGGAGGAGGRADSDAVAFGGNASNRNDVDTNVKTNVDTDVRNSANSGSFSGASSNQKQGQGQFQGQGQSSEQGQNQGISAFNGNTTTVEAPDVKAMGKELAKHASSSAEVRSDSKGGDSPCGDSTGLSAQAGLGGAGFATTSETCKAFRLQRLQATDTEGSVSTTLAGITYYVGWFPRTVLHVATFGVLN